jgi:hypothetical protein
MCRDDPNKVLFAAVTKGMGKDKILGVLGVKHIKQICAELDQGGDFKCEKIFGTGATGTVWLPAACTCQVMPVCMQSSDDLALSTSVGYALASGPAAIVCH